MGPRPPAPFNIYDMILQGSGLRRHGPIFVVGVPRRSLGYAFVAPPRIWSRVAVTRCTPILQRPASGTAPA